MYKSSKSTRQEAREPWLACILHFVRQRWAKEIRINSLRWCKGKYLLYLARYLVTIMLLVEVCFRG